MKYADPIILTACILNYAKVDMTAKKSQDTDTPKSPRPVSEDTILKVAKEVVVKFIEVGQIVDVNFISPKGLNPTGMYKAEIRHITKMEKGKYNGHRLVGILILESLNQ